MQEGGTILVLTPSFFLPTSYPAWLHLLHSSQLQHCLPPPPGHQNDVIKKRPGGSEESCNNKLIWKEPFRYRGRQKLSAEEVGDQQGRECECEKWGASTRIVPSSEDVEGVKINDLFNPLPTPCPLRGSTILMLAPHFSHSHSLHF